ncbi:hypothetical protein GCM10010510_23570 [Streptomyces anandii JCM 4720]|nr:hypothetical protein GCM10010510_23570 [Streptomyces anandii JCM 4720]
MLTPRLNARIGVGPAIVVGAALNAGFVVAAWAPRTGTVPWPLLGFTVTAVGVSIWNVNAVSLRQATTEDAMLARMNAANRFLIWGTMPLGAAAGGLPADQFGLRATVASARWPRPPARCRCCSPPCGGCRPCRSRRRPCGLRCGLRGGFRGTRPRRPAPSAES